MLKVVTLMLVIFSAFSKAMIPFEKRELQLAAKKYHLNYTVNFEQKTLNASGVITVINTSNKEANYIPLRLYRLLKITSISDINGASLNFSQQILSNEDWPVLQTNYIEVLLDKSLKPHETYQFKLQFDGSLLGYIETGMQYVKDSISEDFTIIRMDAFAYPLVTYPNDNVNKRAKFWLNTYDYDVTINVPKGFVVANGGELISKSEQGDISSYRYTNNLPAWRMDFGIAKYKHYSLGNYSVFSWESDADSRELLKKISQTFELYTSWFGPLNQSLGYTFIEVPENYGAQADVTAVIQDAAGFKERDRVYHEISHQWNVKSLDQYSPRWNEGLATFLEELTLDKLDRPGHLNSQTNKYLANLRNIFKQNDDYDKTAFIDYGKAGLSSYTVGMVFYRLMYDLLGEQEFNSIIGGFYQKYYESGATTDDFVKFVKDSSAIDLTHFFNEWAYTPTYIKRISQYHEYKHLVAFYKSNNQIQPTRNSGAAD